MLQGSRVVSKTSADDCYRPLLDADTTLLAEYCLAEIAHPTNEWKDLHFFKFLKLDLDHVLTICPLFESIHAHTPIRRFAISHMPPEFFYKLHTDHERGCCINMLLVDTSSTCAFIAVNPGEKTYTMANPTEYVPRESNLTVGEVGSHPMGHAFKLDYEVNVPYAFNTQQPHMVMNWGEDRYLFTVEFNEDLSELPYRGLIKRLKRGGQI